MITNSQSESTLVTQSVFVGDPVSGLRNIESFGSILQVCAAPFSDLNRLMTTVSRQAYVAYLIDAAKIYTGHGNGNRNIGERLKPEELKQAQVFIIYSLDPRYDKRVAAYVEARLIDVAYELGVPLANSNRPFGRNGLRICPNQEQLVSHAKFLLKVAGFRRFGDANTTDRPTRLAATADLHDVSIPADAVIERLVHRSLQAEGYRIGKPRLGIQVNGHLSCRIWRRKPGFQPALLRRVLTLPFDLLARTRPRAKRRITAMFLAPWPAR